MNYNDTALQEDVFEDVDDNSLRDEPDTMRIVLQYMHMTVGVISFILYLCVVVTDVLLIYVVVKFKRLKSRVNNYIKYFAVSNLLQYVSVPLFFIIHHIFPYVSGRFTFDIIVIIEISCLLFDFLFAFVLAFDWLVMTFKPEIGVRIKRFYDHVLLVIFTLGFVNIVMQCIITFLGYRAGFFILSTIYFLITLFLVVLNCLNYKHKNLLRGTKPVYSLIIANVIVFTWLPMFLYQVAFELIVFTENILIIHQVTYFIPGWLANSSSIIVAVTLVKLNKYFSMAFRRLFKRSVRHYDDEEDLDGSESDANNLENGASVLYDNTTTSIKL